MAGDYFSSAIDKVKKSFRLDEIGYSKQIHSDIVSIYDGTVGFGDGLITAAARTGVGIFTADCVPVIIFDSSKNVCAAVHSGWKGTYSRITIKAIRKMQNEFGCNAKDMNVFIGPHIGGCCYEVGQELVEKFRNEELYEGHTVVDDRKLNLEECIKVQCISEGLK
jgi:Uncharacterized conserved protein